MKGGIADALLIAAGGPSKASRDNDDEETVEDKAEKMPITPAFASAARDVYDAVKAENPDKFLDALHNAVCIYHLQESGTKDAKSSSDEEGDDY